MLVANSGRLVVRSFYLSSRESLVVTLVCVSLQKTNPGQDHLSHSFQLSNEVPRARSDVNLLFRFLVSICSFHFRPWQMVATAHIIFSSLPLSILSPALTPFILGQRLWACATNW